MDDTIERIMSDRKVWERVWDNSHRFQKYIYHFEEIEGIHGGEDPQKKSLGIIVDQLYNKVIKETLVKITIRREIRTNFRNND
jgi:hypothetical protein